MKEIIRKRVLNFPLVHKTLRYIYILIKEFQRFINLLISVPLLLLPIKNKKIVIVNRNGERFSDNPKYVTRELIKKSHNLDLVWLVNDIEYSWDFPKEVRLVKFGGLKSLYELSTSKIWIDNCRKSFYPIKRQDQFYINTWHAGVPLKRIGKDTKQNLIKFDIRNNIRDSKMADLMISNSKLTTKVMSDSFWYDGEIAKYGIPKIDPVIKNDNSLKKCIYEKYNISTDKKVVLYAPTFRYSNSLENYNINVKILLESLEKKYNSNWIFMYRLHPSMKNYSSKLNYGEMSVNVTDHDDMQELLVACDILITDYSSTMFEYLHTERPVFIYAADKEYYGENRGLYFNLNDLPFPVAKSNKELEKNILKFNNISYLKKAKEFMTNQEIVKSSDASYKLAGRIMKEIYNHKK